MTTTYTLTNVELLERDARASEATLAGACGRGLPQPGWPACHQQGTWWVARPTGRPFEHPYCTKHAAMRLRAADRLRAGAQG